MKIKELIIDGFGHFGNGKSFGPFYKPVVVFYGRNESGKSTLLNFIRTILFGFPTRHRSLNYYPALQGGKHGGRIVVIDGGNSEFVIERHEGKKGGQYAVSKVSGEMCPLTKLRELVGNSNKEVFDNIFAFTHKELQSNILRNENIDSQLFSAGMGTTNLPNIMKQINSDMDELYKPGGSKPRVNKIASDIDAKEQEIRDIARDLGVFDELVQKEQLNEKLVAESLDKKNLIKERIIYLESMSKAWEHWVRLSDLEKQIQQADKDPKLPEGFIDRPMEELQNCRNAITNANDDVREVLEQWESSKLKVDSVKPDVEILKDEFEIKAINEQRAEVVGYIKDLPDREKDLSLQRTEVQKKLGELGNGWDIERLEATDLLSIPVGLEVDRQKEIISRNRELFGKQESSYEELKKENSLEDEKDLEDKKNGLDGIKSPTYDQDELDLKKSLLGDAEKSHDFYKSSLAELQALQASGAEAIQSSNHKISRLVVLAICGFTSVAIVLADLFIGQGFSVTTGLVALFVGLLGGIYFTTGRKIVSFETIDSLTEARRKVCEQHKNRLDNVLEKLGLDFEQIDRLNSIHKDYDQVQEEIRQWEKLRAKKDEIEKKQSRIKEKQKLLKELENKLGKSEDEWSNWLLKKELPDDLIPEDISYYRVKIEAARETQKSTDQKLQRLKAVRNGITRYCDQVGPLANRHNEKYVYGDYHSIIKTADKLSGRLEEAKKQNILRTTLLHDRKKNRTNLERSQSKLTEAQENLTRLLENADAKNEDSFGVMARNTENWEELVRTRNEADNRLKILSGIETHLDSFKEDLSARNISDIKSERLRLEDQLNVEEQQHDKFVAERAIAKADIDELKSEDKLSGLRMEKNQLLEQLSEGVRSWTKFKLAKMMLERGIEKFQDERKPVVIKNAQEMFSVITESRYPELHSPIEDKKSIIVSEKLGLRKSPQELSVGTREQLYLSLRFGLIKEYGNSSESLPVIVDEILINFDPQRAARTATAFGNLSETNQVLVFTCHPWIVDVFRSVKQGAQIVEI